MKLQAIIKRPPDVEIPETEYLGKVLASMKSFAQASPKICP